MVITNMIKKCVCCNSKNLKKVKSFYKPPTKEPDYKIKKYFREIYICCDCGNFHNFSNVNMNKIYENDYSQISYGASLWNKLIKVYNLKKKSDNFHRVNRILSKYKKYKKHKDFSILDVGAGFGLFLYTVNKKNKIWKLQAIEPDKNNIKFIKKKLKIKASKGFIEKISTAKRFNLITLNKVLEHTKRPLQVLNKLKNNLKNNGEIYIELPDGEAAAKEGFHREEFFIDHHYIFSKKSFKKLLANANFRIISLKRIKEPSNKYTLFAFVKLKK